MLLNESTPVHNGEPLDHIEMLIVDLVPSAGATPSEPPLLSLADAVIGHYQLSADLRHALHYTALPTPWVVGLGAGEGEPLRIGSEAAWSLPPGASVGMLEFTRPRRQCDCRRNDARGAAYGRAGSSTAGRTATVC